MLNKHAFGILFICLTQGPATFQRQRLGYVFIYKISFFFFYEQRVCLRRKKLFTVWTTAWSPYTVRMSKNMTCKGSVFEENRFYQNLKYPYWIFCRTRIAYQECWLRVNDPDPNIFVFWLLVRNWWWIVLKSRWSIVFFLGTQHFFNFPHTQLKNNRSNDSSVLVRLLYAIGSSRWTFSNW